MSEHSQRSLSCEIARRTPIIRSQLAGGGGAQIIDSALAGRQPARHPGVVSPYFLLPLGYEPNDGGLRRLARSLPYCLAWAVALLTYLPRWRVSPAFRSISARLVHKSVHTVAMASGHLLGRAPYGLRRVLRDRRNFR